MRDNPQREVFLVESGAYKYYARLQVLLILGITAQKFTQKVCKAAQASILNSDHPKPVGRCI